MSQRDKLIEVIGKASTKKFGTIQSTATPEEIEAIADALLERFCCHEHCYCSDGSHNNSDGKECCHCGRTRDAKE